MTTPMAPRSPRLSRRARLGVRAAALALLTVLGSSGVAIAADRSIEMREIAFSPQTVEIRVGDRVTWTNRDAVEHNATNGSFDTGLLAQGESASIRFDAPGTYAFYCEPHQSMTGTVIVRSTSAPATDTATDSTAAPTAGDPTLGLLLAAFAVGILVVTRRSHRPTPADPDRPAA